MHFKRGSKPIYWTRRQKGVGIGCQKHWQIDAASERILTSRAMTRISRDLADILTAILLTSSHSQMMNLNHVPPKDPKIGQPTPITPIPIPKTQGMLTSFPRELWICGRLLGRRSPELSRWMGCKTRRRGRWKGRALTSGRLGQWWVAWLT